MPCANGILDNKTNLCPDHLAYLRPGRPNLEDAASDGVVAVGEARVDEVHEDVGAGVAAAVHAYVSIK